MAAERPTARRRCGLQAVMGFEPLTLGVDQTDEGDGRVEQISGKRRDAVKGLRRQGVENPIVEQGIKPRAFLHLSVPPRISRQNLSLRRPYKR